ncbi:hypothetical protein F0726_02852 [Acidithiobacillus caldus]|nr:hypothetical protein F0726_02852 [Acidithiobacillus caldus]
MRAAESSKDPEKQGGRSFVLLDCWLTVGGDWLQNVGKSGLLPTKRNMLS